MYLIGIDLQFGVGAGGHPFPRSLHLVKFELSKESKQGLNGKDVFLGEISSEKGSTKALPRPTLLWTHLFLPQAICIFLG